MADSPIIYYFIYVLIKNHDISNQTFDEFRPSSSLETFWDIISIFYSSLSLKTELPQKWERQDFSQQNHHNC